MVNRNIKDKLNNVSLTNVLSSFSRLEVEMSFRSFSENGLLLYGGVGKDEEIGDTDFIAIAIVDRFIEFSFDLGGGMVVLKSLKQISLGNNIVKNNEY